MQFDGLDLPPAEFVFLAERRPAAMACEIADLALPVARAASPRVYISSPSRYALPFTRRGKLAT